MPKELLDFERRMTSEELMQQMYELQRARMETEKRHREIRFKMGLFRDPRDFSRVDSSQPAVAKTGKKDPGNMQTSFKPALP